MKETLSREAVGRLLGLLVHDLRNPTATMTANLDFVQEVGFADEEALDALRDVQTSVGMLKRGLDLLSWIARWMIGESPLEKSGGDVGVFIRRLDQSTLPVPIELDIHEEDNLYAHGAKAVVEVIDILLGNAAAHAPGQPVKIKVYRDEKHVIVEMHDKAKALAKELRELAFTLEGQKLLKGRADGRYSRFAGMLACAAAMDGLGGSIESSGTDGDAIFKLRLRRSTPSSPPAK